MQDEGDQLVHFNEIFDLPNQSILREDCQQCVEKLGNDEDDKVSVVSDLESILTFYCKSRNLKYERNNGWIELLLPLIALKVPKSKIYNLFEAIRDSYIPQSCHKNGNAFHVLRLLLLYYDPVLCSFLDTKRITPELYCLTWFQSLFAATCSLPVILSMWDLYFQQSDPFFVFFLSLIMVVNARDQIISMKNESKETIVNTIANMPCALEAEDVADFCSLAQYYTIKTPVSFRTDLMQNLYKSLGDLAEDNAVVSQALCLPVSAGELIENARLETLNPDSVRFFLVDCRPADQYNAGHLPTAFHLDCNLMLQEPAAFSVAVQGLLNAQKQALVANSNAGGEHLCFLGSGRLEEDQYTHMVVASFLQKHTQFVSMVTGGYNSIHEYFGENVNSCLQDHNSYKCLVCNPNPGLTPIENLKTTQSVDLLGKISAAMKLKSAEVKGKLFDYIVNPNNSNNTPVIGKHVSSNDKNSQIYRNVTPVFSIDDESDNMSVQTADDDDVQECVPLNTWLKDPDVIEVFKCQEVRENGYMFNSHLIVTESHIIVLREIPEKKGMTQVIVRRPLSSIVKITAKKRHPELITFKYGVPDGDTLLISDMDRFLIPNASKATKIVSEQILKQLKYKEEP